MEIVKYLNFETLQRFMKVVELVRRQTKVGGKKAMKN